MPWCRWLGAMLLLGLPSAAWAQHPCDVVTGSSGTAIEGLVTLGWCHNTQDVNGLSTQISQWNIYVNGSATPLVAVMTDGTRSSQGDVLYQATVPFLRGTYSIEVSAVNSAGESAHTPPFALGVAAADSPSVPSVPSAPRFPRVLSGSI
jgi:hypothetical protein